MTERKPKKATKVTQKPAKSTIADRKTSIGLTAEEKAAMRETIADQKRVARGADGVAMLLEKIAAMQQPDRAMATRLHAIITSAAPELTPKTWYGMPAYANKDGKVVVFFRNAGKFKERYSMLGFNDSAKLDHGSMWPIAFAVKELTAADETKIRALVKKAVG